MNDSNYLGYIPGQSFLHRLSGTTKLIGFLSLSLITMVSYDIRYLAIVGLISISLFFITKIPWSAIKVPVYFVVVFALINLAAVYLFAPEQGVVIFGSRHLIWEGIGRFTLTWEQLIYEGNIALKYFTTIPLAFIFILTTNPSEFASSLNSIGISYRISYAVALALRYIPDIQTDFYEIRQSQQARGLEMSSKASVIDRLKHNSQIILPIIFNSLNRIDVISQAMELRRFGKEKGRTWYMHQSFKPRDWVVVAIVVLLVLLGIGLLFMNGSRFYNPLV